MMKEMMLRATSSDDAIRRLNSAFGRYIADNNPSSWSWKIAPEVKWDEKRNRWCAYGRIEFRKS